MKKEDLLEITENEKLREEIKGLTHNNTTLARQNVELETKLNGQITGFEFVIAGMVSNYEAQLQTLSDVNNSLKTQVECLQKQLDKHKLVANIDIEKIAKSVKIKDYFTSTGTNSVTTSVNNTNKFDIIKRRDPYLHKAILAFIDYVSICYTDKYYNKDNYIDMDNFMIEDERYADGFIIGNMMKYLTRYKGDLKRLIDLHKLIHYGFFSLRRRFKENEKEVN